MRKHLKMRVTLHAMHSPIEIVHVLTKKFHHMRKFSEKCPNWRGLLL